MEARCICRWDGGEGEVKALLESRDLILRGAVRRTIPVPKLADVVADGGLLTFCIDGECLSLDLGEDRAKRWAIRIATPPPSLARKLGIMDGARIWVIGDVEDPALLDALADARAEAAADASLSLAVVPDAAALQQALHSYQKANIPGPIWLVHGKGARAAFGEGPVRAHMRGAGYIDTKVSAVSETLSATRYARRPS